MSTAPAPERWTVRKLLAWTTKHFEAKAVDAPRLTAELLLAHTLKAERIKLYVDFDRPLEVAELATFKGLIQRRLSGEPTDYLTGAKLFYGRKFRVDPRVLIPRGETELLVEAVLSRLPKDVPARVLDLCTGSGCIAATLAAERPQCSVWAVDLSADACALARENIEALGVGSRVTVMEGDLFAPLPEGPRFDAIVSNPPYVATGQLAGLQREVQREPKLALDGGPDGLTVLRRIAQGAPARLKPGALLALEISEEEGAAVAALLNEAGLRNVRVEADLARLDRLVLGDAP